MIKVQINDIRTHDKYDMTAMPCHGMETLIAQIIIIFRRVFICVKKILITDFKGPNGVPMFFYPIR